jgi:hypothetical protein
MGVGSGLTSARQASALDRSPHVYWQGDLGLPPDRTGGERLLELRETLRLYTSAARKHTETASAETMARRPDGVKSARSLVSMVHSDGVTDGRATLLDALHLAHGDRLGKC